MSEGNDFLNKCGEEVLISSLSESLKYNMITMATIITISYK